MKNDTDTTAGSDCPAATCSADDEKIYPCADCGMPRSKNEGGTVFTVCDDCWDKHYTKQNKLFNESGYCS